jgi:polyisoprenoid-binding protein YceI
VPRALRLGIIVVLAIALLVVGGPWVYINFVRDEAPESFLDEATAVVAELTDPSGMWKVSADSQVGYRVDEVLFGQNVTAVGRTSAVTGEVTIADLTVTTARFEVDMTTVTSDEPKRDARFASRIMDTLNYPTSAFVLDTPIELAAESTSGSTSHAARGTLTLRGASKSVDLTVTSSFSDGRIVVVGEIPIVFADFGIPNPSIPGISTEDSGVLEFNLVLER